MAIEDKSLFISSCSRRDLARRRPHRAMPPLPAAVIALLLAMAVAGAVLVTQGVV